MKESFIKKLEDSWLCFKIVKRAPHFAFNLIITLGIISLI